MDKEHRRKSDRGVQALMTDTLRDLFGIEAKAVDQVMDVLKRTGQYANAKNHIRNLPPDAHRYWVRTLDRAEAEIGSEDETEKKDKEEHVEEKHPGQEESKKEDDKKPDSKTNESNSFKGSFITYLTELNSREIAQTTTQGKAERLKNARLNDKALTMKRAEEIEAEKKSDDPLDKQIYAARNRLAMLIKKKEEGGSTGGGIPEGWEEVWVDSETNAVIVDSETGEPLSESAVRAFKRYKGKLVKKYRCLSGPKKGRLASNPGDCAERKDPKRVRQGRISARKSQGSRITKTRIAKRQFGSRLLTRMNKRLSGKLTPDSETKVKPVKPATVKKAK